MKMEMEHMKILHTAWGGIAGFILELLVGILLLIDPIGFTSGIIIAAGIALIILALVYIIRYFKTETAVATVEKSLFRGLLFLLIGIFCVTKSAWFVATFPLLTIVYGTVILVAGLAKVQWTVDIIRLKARKLYLPAVSAALSVLCGLLILWNPFKTTEILWKFTGIAMIVDAVFDLLALLFGKKKQDELPFEE